jgi:hypothetical protein
MSADWLPPLVLRNDFDSDEAYGEALYGWFKNDFIDSLPTWPGKRVGLKRLPLMRGRVATFYHFLTGGEDEAARGIDYLRCERIRWPRPTMETFPDRRPTAEDRIIWWMNQRRGEWRYLLALPDFSYLVVVAVRREYVLPWTHYVITQAPEREKKRREFESYWANRKS